MQTPPLVGVHSTAIDPVLTALQWVGPRGEKTLLQAAGAQHLALAEGDVAEVIAGRTALVPPEGIQLAFVQETPFLHDNLKTVRLY